VAACLAGELRSAFDRRAGWGAAELERTAGVEIEVEIEVELEVEIDRASPPGAVEEESGDRILALGANHSRPV